MIMIIIYTLTDLILNSNQSGTEMLVLVQLLALALPLLLTLQAKVDEPPQGESNQKLAMNNA